METQGDQSSQVNVLRASIGIVTRGGPVTVNLPQDTKPVMLKGMQLPAEARYSFRDPTDYSSQYVNHPISIELFFGENGRERSDLSLGAYQLQEFLPRSGGSINIELRLEVSSDQVLSITLVDARRQKSRSIGFIDISALDPPPIEPTPMINASEAIRNLVQELVREAEDPQPRQVETRKPRRGRDLMQEITLSFDEALHGGRRDIEVPGAQTCPACNGDGTAPGKSLSPCADCRGTGWTRKMKDTPAGRQYHFEGCTTCHGDGLVNAYPCPTCWGSGWVEVKRQITVQIPAHIDSSAVICIPHQGEPGRSGGLPGHLRITANIVAHAFLTRSGRDICVELPVRASVARQGGRLRVPAPEKGRSILLDLPAGTRDHAEFRVAEYEEYSLTARVETYRPAFLLVLPKISQRIKAIREWLDGADIEISAAGESDVDATMPTSAAPATASSHPLPRHSTRQAEFYTRRGILYAEKGDREHSLADFSMAIELDPEHAASAYDNRAACYAGQQEFEKALSDMERALELAPNNAEYYCHRGLLYHAQRDPARAQADYAKALELDSTNAEIYETRGVTFLSQGDLEAALADFSRALELDPTRVNCYHRRGIIYLKQARYKDALDDFDRSLRLHPGDPWQYLWIGHAYRGLGEKKKAVDYCKRALDASQSPELRQEAQKLLSELGSAHDRDA